MCSWIASRERGVLPPGERPAAVLLPLIRRPSGYEVVFTERSQNLMLHRGEVCFPGGRVQAHDRDLTDTVLREVEEELGVPPEKITLWGALDDCTTLQGIRMTPFVGQISDVVEYRPNPEEVAAVFTERLANFLPRRAARREDWVDWEGNSRAVVFYDRPPYTIWGATARILYTWLSALEKDPVAGRELLEILMGCREDSLDDV
ncbi:MAG: CoA pyrophosphatase [Candidatus Sericytochromatia bacterium]|nr:CoA pyrophosphatase [Candidatus Sericytochromatia bacterium]